MANKLPSYFKLDTWLIDIDQNQITDLDGKSSKLEPKSMLVLQYLASKPRETISRDDLFEACWPNQVVTEDALNRVISSLRRKLGDTAGSPKFIATVRNAGYKLIVPIHELDNPRFIDTTTSNSEEHLATSQTLTEQKPVLQKKKIRSLVAICFSLLLGCIILIYSFQKDPEIAKHQFERISYNTQQNSMPKLASNGEVLAFIQQSVNHPNKLKIRYLPDTYAEDISAANKHYLYPSFYNSADNIAVLSQDIKTNLIQIEKITLSNKTSEPLLKIPHMSHGLSVHPKGDEIVFTQPISTNAQSQNHTIYTFNQKQQKMYPIFLPHSQYSDRLPNYSPSGEYIAFLRNKSQFQDALFVSDMNGKTTQLSNYNDTIFDLTWISNHQIIITKNKGVYIFDLDKKEQIWHSASPLQSYQEITYSLDTKQLILTAKQTINTANIFDLTNSTDGYLLTKAEAQDTELSVNYNGTAFVFVTNRSGKKSLWFRKSNKTNIIKNTEADEIYDLVWHPNNQYLVAAYKLQSEYGLMIYDLNTQTVYKKRYNKNPIHIIDWRNNQELLISVENNLQWKLNTVSFNNFIPTALRPIENSAELDIFQGRLSPNKKTLYFLTSNKSHIFSWDFKASPQVINLKTENIYRNWFVDNTKLFHFNLPTWNRSTNQKVADLIAFDFKTQATSIIKQYPNIQMQYRPQRLINGFTAVKNNKLQGDLWLIETNFD
ncbi:winged helix-turn-helix domain-containing protein [Pseudoalteromonas sp. C2R02]|uniref:winged helix-turn-helix domain-containing protein n=1 Tax=Pseudoalteromonas sp. C2R02 TaxID=2841565 RepID=UPI001C0A3992|nr:winged helix-turn-helix domain-containing protein [Pseudoalteromonas sp. C2R02]MBU2967788.1 winged helix-turn-helix domain-containing protein [Pseudoalteromonas sp. C2R02]